MNQKRQRFVEAFVGEAQGNGTKAAILAGYSEKSARKIASELQTFPDVKQAIEARQHALIAASETSTQRIIQELEAVAFTPVDVKSGDKMKALELLGKHRKIWEDSGPKENRIIVVGFLANRGKHPDTNIIDVTPTQANRDQTHEPKP